MKFVFFCLLALPLAAQESLRYSINWASGLSLGEATLTSLPSKPAEGQPVLQFSLKVDASIPGFAVVDEFKSLASANYCSMEFDKSLAHGKRKSKEKIEFSKGEATRKTLGGGGKTTFSTPSCPKDALTFLQYARREIALGKVPQSEPVIFGAVYQVRFDYAGEQKIRISDTMTPADRLLGFVKGPKSDFTFEIFFGRDAQRTPLLIKVPFTLGTFSMELVR
jgi:hypothetical protein